MAAPVKITCPDIDKYIRWIKLVMVKERDLANMNEKDLFDTASAMNSELQECIGYLEDLRSSNSALRDWGEGLDEELEAAAAQISELEDKLENNLVD
jgi:predicted nuclease with TOPRIM domain